MTTATLDTAIAELIEAIKLDYVTYSLITFREAKTAEEAERRRGHREQMIEEFKAGVHVGGGQKFIKIVTGNSVWGFIAAEDITPGKGRKPTPPFRKGDILKAAGWNAPAKNFARGNVLDGGYTIRWTGA